MPSTPLPTKLCARCGRSMTWRKAWARSWEERRFCGERCRRTRLDDTDAALEATIRQLLAARVRDASICPSEVARKVFGEDAWRGEMERTRRAAQRLSATGEVEITQRGAVVDVDHAKGPIRIRIPARRGLAWPEIVARVHRQLSFGKSAMRFSSDETRVFHDSGFVLKRALFRDHEVLAVRDALERLYATAQTLTSTGDHDGAFFALGRAETGSVVVQRVVWAGGAEPGLLRLSEDPRLVEPALDLLGTPYCEQLLCQAHYKMPNDGVAFDWHQDIQHRDKGGDTWRDVNGRGSFVQTILLVDDMTDENGPLEFVPAEAVALDERGRLVKGSVDASRAVSVTGRAGDVLFFGPYAVHGSLPNVSAKPRRVLINGYAAPGANARFYPGRGACRVLPSEPLRHAV